MNMTFVAARKHKVEKAFNRALLVAREQILTDCNFYVRVDQGTLRDTARTEVDNMELTVIYDQPYAKKVYYTGVPSTDKNPNASLMWCAKAARKNKKTWGQILEKGMNANL